MEKTELVPYFHPTQLVLVDDDIDFLGNLSLQLEADLAYLLFDSTTKALNYINDLQGQTASPRRFFEIVDHGEPRADGTHRPRVRLDTGALVKEMYFTNRFSRISVAMVDYAMPQMNGLEFCERIDNPYIKKILFTGVATEADAVDAFNRGVIDRYIRKSEHYVYDNLNRTIRELQVAHIRDTFAAATEIFDVDKPALLRDPSVIELLTDLRARYGFVEYYLTADPWGFMLVNSDGQVHRLVLYDQQAMAEELAHARACGAPDDCQDALARGDLLLSPLIKQGDTVAQCANYHHWQQYAHAASRLEGRQEYLWALLDQKLSNHRPLAPVAAYNRYLEWLDTVGYSLM